MECEKTKGRKKTSRRVRPLCFASRGAAADERSREEKPRTPPLGEKEGVPNADTFLLLLLLLLLALKPAAVIPDACQRAAAVDCVDVCAAGRPDQETLFVPLASVPHGHCQQVSKNALYKAKRAARGSL
ncbi:hypothetical protein EYF80_019496 [Liparis tanakae]|uniref:Uncharacterized protein n=1 Tax=Liparis tanakae TaxID=230148 RepID=A0A4Z2HZA2_9TELE|nr:hypothetical protein EYF80_019496 [Liparis tanakae]